MIITKILSMTLFSIFKFGKMVFTYEKLNATMDHLYNATVWQGSRSGRAETQQVRQCLSPPKPKNLPHCSTTQVEHSVSVSVESDLGTETVWSFLSLLDQSEHPCFHWSLPVT